MNYKNLKVILMSILMFLSLAYNFLAYVETTKVIKISDNILSLTLQDSPKLA